MESDIQPAVTQKRRFPLFLTVFFAVFLAIILGGLFVKWVYFPSSFSPVSLSSGEQKQLNEKLGFFGIQVEDESVVTDPNKPLQPEAYSETGASREVKFSEKELIKYSSS